MWLGFATTHRAKKRNLHIPFTLVAFCGIFPDVSEDKKSGPERFDVDFPRNMMEFLDRFATDQACLAYLSQVRWPGRFVCPACRGRLGWLTNRGTVFCGGCDRQTSPTAGTILHNTRTPIRKWFLAGWLLCTQKTGVSAKTLQRELQVGYKTAWLILQKLRQATVRAERSQLTGKVEVDETYVGGQESGVVGRQLVDKALVVMAVELEGKKVGRVRLRHVPDASGASLVGFLTDCVAQGATVKTDDWNGYNGVQAAGFVHRVTSLQGDLQRAEKHFPHVHLVASLLKRWLLSTHQGRVEKEHLQAYLDEYAFRFNRRRSMHVGKIFHRLMEQMVLRKAKTYRQIVNRGENN
jgi:transposase-like protein